MSSLKSKQHWLRRQRAYPYLAQRGQTKRWQLKGFILTSALSLKLTTCILLWQMPSFSWSILALSTLKPKLIQLLIGTLSGSFFYTLWHIMRRPPKRPRGFSLYIGHSTGELLKRHHPGGLKAKQPVCLSLRDATLNLLILGGIGEGKTQTLIHPILLQLLDQDCGGLIFDIKGNFHRTVEQLATSTGKKLTLIGPGRQQINLIAGLTPESAANLLRAIVFMMSGGGQNQFWVTQATQLMQGALGVLSFFPAHYTLAGLATFIFQADFRENLQKEIATQTLSETQSQLLSSYQTSLSLFEQMPERTQGDIKATVATVLSPCTHPHIASSFSAVTNQALPLADVIKGQVFCLDMPQSAYGQATRIIATAIKLRWFQVMASRRRHLNWNQTRPVFFLCDEYQSLVTADPNGQTLSDLTFWDKARDTNTLGIVAAQSVSSLYAAIGDRAATETLLANFRQKLCFKTEDPETLRYLQSIIGQVSAPKSQRSQQRSTTRQSHGVSQSHSQSESQAEQMQSVIDSQLMRLLKRHQVIALLLLGLEARDDLLSVQPLEITTR